MAKKQQPMFVIEDQGRPVVIFPERAARQYRHLLGLAGYSQRAARKGEAERLPHLVHTPVRRPRKSGGGGQDSQLALFRDLPEVKRFRAEGWRDDL